MITWTNFASGFGAATTTWNYDPYGGWLTSKLDATSHGPVYTYSAAGRLTYTTWARSGQSIDIAYDNLGLPAYRSYPAGGPTNPYFTYDRRNRMTLLTQGGNTTTCYYNDAGQLTGSYQSGGTLSGYALTNQFDNFLRKSYVAARAPSGVWYGGATYGYDNASRLHTVSFGEVTATYGYLANSALVGNLTAQQNGATRLTVSKSYDYLNRLSSVSSTPSGAGAVSFAYGYNDANQRVQMTCADGCYWVYQYDSLGQVRSGKRYWSGGTPVAGQQFEYGFDDIANRTSTKAGGDASGLSLRTASYAPNSLNQYGTRTVPGAVDVLGIADAAWTVTVNSQGTYRRGEYFHLALSLSNGSSPVYQSVTASAVNGGSSTNITGNVLLSAAGESYAHDLDGNLTSDGLWTYTWDAENRLVTMQSLATVPAGGKKQLTFEYDYLGRRIAKNVYTWNGSAYVWQSQVKYLYDGWNLIGEFDASNNRLCSYGWGLDLSGSFQGAGGIGGLVAVKVASGATYLAAGDGNGNVVAFVDGTTGAYSANYEYGPFGEVIRATSSISPAIPIRWSTKYTDLETDLVYYGYRYYNPSTGRWLSRDPLMQGNSEHLLRPTLLEDLATDLNEYIFVSNDPISKLDVLGAGLLCDCQVGARKGVPMSNYDSKGKPTIDGGVICDQSKLGTPGKRTVTNMCQNRLFTPKFCFDCFTVNCQFTVDYVCTQTKKKDGSLNYVWLSTGTANLSKPCPR